MSNKLRKFYNSSTTVKMLTVIVVVFLSVAVMLPLIKIAAFFGVNVRENTALNFDVSFGHVFFFFLFGVCSIGIIWSAQKYIHHKKFSSLGFKAKIWPVLFLGFIFGAVLAVVKYLLLILNAEAVNYVWVVNSTISPLSYLGYYAYFLVGFIFWNSFIEELATRAYPIEALKNHVNPHIIFTIMGLIFTLGHFVLRDFSPGFFCSLFATSYLYSMLYYYSGSIWLSAGIHSGANWVSFSYFGTNWKLGALYNIEIYEVPYWIAEYSNAIVQLIALLLVLYLNKKGFFQKFFPRAPQTS